jgi:hypothetical protein
MAFSKMVDMARTPAEKAEEAARMAGPAAADIRDYPFGLCLSLDQDDLEKLDLDDDCEVGDMIDLRAFARVTSRSENTVNGEKRVRIELQVEQLAIEDEDKEQPGE